MNITLVLVILCGVTTAGMGVEGYLLKKSYERSAELKASNTALMNKVKEINDVLKQVDQTHSTNIALPDDKLFDGLLPSAPASER